MPKSLNHSQAASLPVVALTNSLEAYQISNLKAGDVLVVEASGGCGIYGITFAAKVIGAKPTGICSTRNMEFVNRSVLWLWLTYTNLKRNFKN